MVELVKISEYLEKLLPFDLVFHFSNKGSRQKKKVENSTLGLTPTITKSVEN